jgi:outer membrane protein assembly factor BamB
MIRSGMLSALAVLGVSSAIAADPPSYRVLGADNGKIAIVGANGVVEWEIPNPTEVHNVAYLPGGNVMFTVKGPAIVEMNPQKEVVWKYECKPNAENRQRVEVHAFQRLADGSTMIAETGNKRIIEVDREGKIVKEVPLTIDRPDPHRDTRMARKLSDGHYLVCHEGDGKVREYDGSGKVVWSYSLDLGGRPRSPGHGVEGHGAEVFGALRLPSGNTLIAAGNGNRVIEVNPAGKIVWSVGHDELPGIRLAWVTTLTVRPNGNVIFGNTHAGPENPQLIEVDRQKNVVWTFKNFRTFGNGLAATQVLGVEPESIR